MLELDTTTTLILNKLQRTQLLGDVKVVPDQNDVVILAANVIVDMMAHEDRTNV